jgi:hypothetical protein
MSNKTAVSSSVRVLFPEDVFASWVYSGTGATQVFQNGVNLAVSGGLVWTKRRTGTQHVLVDTVRGADQNISTSADFGFWSDNTAGISSFNANGYTLANNSYTPFNAPGDTYASWTFRRAPRFFDIVTYTGNGSARTIPHQLGVAPGFVLVKRTSSPFDKFYAFHRSAGAGNFFDINGQQAAQASTSIWNNTAPTAEVFSVGADTQSNASGATYVAYLFAHDATAEGAIQCGTYTGNGSSSGPTVTLGWEPQFLLVKPNGSGAGGYACTITDVLRGMSHTNTRFSAADAYQAEVSTSQQIAARPTGFNVIGTHINYNQSGVAYHYVAIRRPRKPPLSAFSVFGHELHTSPGTASSSVVNLGITVDAYLSAVRNAVVNKFYLVDRLRGGQQANASGLTTSAATSELQFSTTVAFDRLDGVVVTDTAGNINGTTGQNVLAYGLRRASRFFDVVCYSGTGAAKTEAHALGVVPELMIVKSRSAASAGAVYASGLTATQRLALFATSGAAAVATDATAWNSTAPTSTVFSVGTSSSTNNNGDTFVAYLFATLAGVSKVGLYTGNGASQTINCGFSAGARFVLIKRTNATGDWYVWDTARGILAGADPRLSMNSSAAEVATDDSVDASSRGFIVNQLAATDINVSGATYLYLAIA